MITRSENFFNMIKSRRTVREFSDEDIPYSVIENALQTALLAPSGANQQPWHFVVVQNPEVKKLIRLGAEQEEREFYATRATPEWLEAIAPLGTDANKEFLEIAPYLVVIFAESYRLKNDTHIKNYYVQESVGLAVGFLIAALHNAGVATLTHTPSPMNFLNKILNRPNNERPYLILVCGLPTSNATVPTIRKKDFVETVSLI